MRIAAAWLNSPAAQAVTGMLEGGGHRALFVGGCVRNALLGAPVNDLDISTNARPERVMALADAARLKTVPTGIDHGTVTVIVKGTPIEVTTFRRDVKTDGRRAVVAFADSVAQDAQRRDFTMNALYCDGRGVIEDPIGGLGDLRARYLRFVGTAQDRVREDYLRILRYFRFLAWYGDPDQGLDPDALDACARHSDGLAQISRERIGGEMLKLLAAPDPAPAVAAMQSTGVLQALLPGAVPDALAPLVHFEKALGVAPASLARLAALTGEEVQATLRLSKADARSFEALTRITRDGAAAPAAMGHQLGPELGRSAALVQAALMGQAPNPDFAADVARGAAAEFPVRAEDLMPTLEGAALGKKLKALKSTWLAGGLRADKQGLLKDDS